MQQIRASELCDQHQISPQNGSDKCIRPSKVGSCVACHILLLPMSSYQWKQMSLSYFLHEVTVSLTGFFL